MASLAKRKVVSVLQRKGFEKDKDGDHVVLTYRKRAGSLSNISTRVSHGSRPKDLGDYLIREMRTQCRLSKDEFIRLANCPMEQKEYEEIVQEHLR